MNTLEDIQTHDVTIETQEGTVYTGRITGKHIAQGQDTSVFLTEDERVLVYDENLRRVDDVSEDPASGLEGLKDHDVDAYIEAMEAIGEKPVIDL